MPLYDPYVTPIFYASLIYQDSSIKGCVFLLCCCHGHGNFQDDFLQTFSFLHVHDPYYPFRLLTNLGKQPGQGKDTVIRTAD